jgi:hypothetical protein
VLRPEDLSIDHEATEALRKEAKEKRGEVPLFTFGEIPEPIGIVAEWYRTRSERDRLERDKIEERIAMKDSIIAAERPHDQHTGTGSTFLPV